MELRVWQSFACNNSSSYRIVARFRDAKVADETREELAKFFTAYAAEMDRALEQGGYSDKMAPVPTAAALAKKYHFKWQRPLTWGDSGLVGDEPEVATEGDVLVLYHSYFFGFGPEMPKYFAARGARKVEKEEYGAPAVSVLFKLPPGKPAIAKELAKIFKGVGEDGTLDDAKVPWSKHKVWGKAAFFSDGKTVGFYLSMRPKHLADMKAWLTKQGVEDASIRLCADDDFDKFRAIGRARCECGGVLEYLDPRIHPTPTEQLACAKCGGMYEVDAFREKEETPKKAKPKPKRARPKKKRR